MDDKTAPPQNTVKMFIFIFMLLLFFRHFNILPTYLNINLMTFFPSLFTFIAEVTVTYVRGLPNVVCPLPSRNEKCQFVLRPVSHNVGDFLEMLKSEDRGIDRAAILNRNGVRIASSCSIESLMDESFW